MRGDLSCVATTQDITSRPGAAQIGRASARRFGRLERIDGRRRRLWARVGGGELRRVGPGSAGGGRCLVQLPPLARIVRRPGRGAGAGGKRLLETLDIGEAILWILLETAQDDGLQLQRQIGPLL